MMIVWFHSMFTSQRSYTMQRFTNHVMIVCMVLICKSQCFHSIMIVFTTNGYVGMVKIRYPNNWMVNTKVD